MAGAMSSADRWFLTGLNQEWLRLGEVEEPRVRGWWSRRPCLAGHDSVATLVTDGRARDDAVLGALLQECGTGDDLAGRVVLQALLPGMVQMAGRDRSADLSDYVAQLWCRIRTYPLERRPQRIANNLELDTLKAICRSRAGDDAVVPVEPDGIERLLGRRAQRGDDQDDDQPDAPAVIGAALAHGLVDDHTADVLRSVYADGLSGREAADRHRCSVDLIRWRCSKAVRTLAQHSMLLAEVA